MSLTILDSLEQGTPEWHDQRRGMLTASVVGQLITERHLTAAEFDCPECSAIAGAPCMSKVKGAADPKPIKTLHAGRSTRAAERKASLPPILEPADNDTSRNLTALLLAERITGWTEPTFTTDDMWRGIESEPIARERYAEVSAVRVTEVGFMVRELPDGHRLGFSPDGLVGDDGLIEVKSPRAKTHIRTIISGEIPPRHMPQIQAGLLVSGRNWLDFISFHGGLPMFVKRVRPNPQWFRVIEEAVARFETTASELQAKYQANAKGLPSTDRLVTDMEMSF